MARVSYLQPDQAPPKVKAIYERLLKGKPGNIHKALAHRPEILETFLPFYASIGKSLDKRLYELLYLRVAIINGCAY